jgi:macrolide transport system ATP-binding/permease protein
MALLNELHGRGTTIVMVTHELNIAEHAGRVIYLIDGEVVSDRTRASGIAHLYNGEGG